MQKSGLGSRPTYLRDWLLYKQFHTHKYVQNIFQIFSYLSDELMLFFYANHYKFSEEIQRPTNANLGRMGMGRLCEPLLALAS